VGTTKAETPCRVGVVVVGTNDLRWLPECFGTLLASSVELIVIYVDNGSTDGSVRYVADSFPSVRIVQNGSDIGYGEANNIGLRLALELGLEYIFLLNPDTRTPPNLIDGLVKFLDRYESYGVVGPLQSVYGDLNNPPLLNDWSKHALENGERHAFHHWINLPSDAGPAEGRAPKTLEHAYVQGAAMMIRMSLLELTGFFDPTYHTYYDEVDFCRRVRWQGFRVALLTEFLIEHKGGSIGLWSYYRDFHMRRNKYYYLFTDPSISMWSAVRLALRWVTYELLTEPQAKTCRPDVRTQVRRVIIWLCQNALSIWQRRRGNTIMFRARREQSVRTCPSRTE